MWTNKDERLGAKLVHIGEVGSLVYPDYPKYYSSPRIILREPDEKIKIEELSALPASTQEGTTRIIVPPLKKLDLVKGLTKS